MSLLSALTDMYEHGKREGAKEERARILAALEEKEQATETFMAVTKTHLDVKAGFGSALRWAIKVVKKE